MSNRMRKQKPSLRAVQESRRAEAARKVAARRRLMWIGAAVAGLVLVVGAGTAIVLATSDDGDEQAIEVDPVALELGCTSCHSSDGARAEGPTWDGLWGSEVTLADGSTVVADEDYVRRAITDPEAEVVQGFTPMPIVDVTDEELDALVAYIESLG